MSACARRLAILDDRVTFGLTDRARGAVRGTTGGGKLRSGASLGSTIDAQVSTRDTQVSTSDTRVSTCDTQVSTIDAQLATTDARGTRSEALGEARDARAASSALPGRAERHPCLDERRAGRVRVAARSQRIDRRSPGGGARLERVDRGAARDRPRSLRFDRRGLRLDRRPLRLDRRLSRVTRHFARVARSLSGGSQPKPRCGRFVFTDPGEAMDPAPFVRGTIRGALRWASIHVDRGGCLPPTRP